MVLPEALARVTGHGEHTLTPNDVMSGNRGRMKQHHAAQAHVLRPFDSLAWVGNSVTHGGIHNYKRYRIPHAGKEGRYSGCRTKTSFDRVLPTGVKPQTLSDIWDAENALVCA